MTTLNAQPRKLWHAGFIVDDVEAAMTELSAGVGLTWNEPHKSVTTVHGPGGVSYHIESMIAFSTNSPLSIELIQPNPGTPNVRRGASAFHHIAYWSDDLVEEDARLTGMGYPCIYYRDDPDNGLRRIMLSEGPFDTIIESCNVKTERHGLEHFYPGQQGTEPKLWHIAFAVPSLERAMAEFSRVLGFEQWTPIKHFVGEALGPEGKPYAIDTRLTFATDGPVALELFESTPGTPNAPAEGTLFHHMGYWAGPIPEEKERLAKNGWFLTGGDTSSESRAAFFSGQLGIWFEACNVDAQRKGLEKYYPNHAGQAH